MKGTAKLSWKPTDKVLAYFSFAHGFKAGGFLASPPTYGLTLRLKPFK